MGTYPLELPLIERVLSAWLVRKRRVWISRLIIRIIPVLKVLEYDGKERQASLRKHTHAIYETSNTSRSEGASGEADQEYLVPFDIVLANMVVGFSDVSGDSLGCGTSHDPAYRTSCRAHAGLVEDTLSYAIRGFRSDGAADPGDVAGERDLPVFEAAIGIQPGAL